MSAVGNPRGDTALSANDLEVAITQLRKADPLLPLASVIGKLENLLAKLLERQAMRPEHPPPADVAPTTLTEEEINAYIDTGMQMCITAAGQQVGEAAHYRLWCLHTALRQRLLVGTAYPQSAIGSPADDAFSSLLLSALKAAYLRGVHDG
jgi:hypothetical protein